MHDDNCGYMQAEEAQPCTHSCELCKPVGDDVEEEDEPASQQPSDIYPACEHHVHDESCGGLVNACTFVCETCIAEINALLASIPSPITDANREQVASIPSFSTCSIPALTASPLPIPMAAQQDISMSLPRPSML